MAQDGKVDYSERHYLLGGPSRRLGASLNHLPDWLTGEHGPGPGGPRVVRFIAMFEEFSIDPDWYGIPVPVPVPTRESELTLESGIIESCLNRLCRVLIVVSRAGPRG